MAITTRSDFVTLIKRRLGEPVIQVNVADEQVEVMLDEVIEKFMEYHRDGSAEVFVAHQVSADEATALQLDIPSHITDITSIVSQGSTAVGSFATHSWQMMASMMNPMGSASLSMTSYVLLKQRLDLINATMGADGDRSDYEYAKYAGKLIPYFAIKEGDLIVYRAYQNVDPRVETPIFDQQDPPVQTGTKYPFAQAWNDTWLKDYAQAKLKMIWGQNLEKFGGIDLPGGVQLSGSRLIDEAQQEIDKLDEELISRHMDMPLPMVG